MRIINADHNDLCVHSPHAASGWSCCVLYVAHYINSAMRAPNCACLNATNELSVVWFRLLLKSESVVLRRHLRTSHHVWTLGVCSCVLVCISAFCGCRYTASLQLASSVFALKFNCPPSLAALHFCRAF